MENKGTGKVTVGHPVDVATGTLFHEFEDFTLSGHSPLVFGRRYSTAMIERPAGIFGVSWSSPFEMRLRHDLDGYHLIAEDGETEIEFDDYEDVVEAGGVLRNLGHFHELRREQDTIIVTRWDPESEAVVRYVFPIGQEGEWWPLQNRLRVDGQGVDIHRDQDGRITFLTQRREGRGFRLEYNADGRVIEVYLTTNLSKRLILGYSYDNAGRLAGMTDALGNRCSYEYDATWRMTREVNIGGMEFRFRYDGKGRCVETTGPDGFDRNVLEINELARMTRVTNPLGHITTYQWNESGQIEREISPLGNIKLTNYDDHGRIIARVSPTGATTAYEYDNRGDRVKVTSPTGAITQYEFDKDHQGAGVTDSLGNKWSWSFDDDGRLSSWSDPLGNLWSYLHNTRGDLTAIKDPLGYQRDFSWDGLGNLASATDWLGHRTAYEYDEEGRAMAMIDPLGYRTEAEYDALGRIHLIRHPDGATRKFSWNVYDQIVEYIDEVGAVTRWRYTPCGLVRKVIRPHGGQVKFKYNNIPGQLITVSNENGEEHYYGYDADGRMVNETGFGSGIRHYEYNKNGQKVAIANAVGHRTELKYNAAGAITEVSCDDGSRITYEYDARGYLIKADNGVCSIEREYNTVGHLILEKQGEYTITSEYDAVGNRSRRQSSLDCETVFEWDGNGQVAKIQFGKFYPILFEYDARHCEVVRYASGEIHINQAFDDRGRVIEQWTGSSYRPGKAIIDHRSVQGVQRRYKYDAASNLTETLDARWGATKYTYDLASRVISSQHTNSLTEQFVYDPADNLKMIERLVGLEVSPDSAIGGEALGWQYGKGNELLNRDGVDYQYNTLGQLIKKTDDKGETVYEWNRLGELIRVILPTGSEWEYKYDPFGRRIAKQETSQQINYVWDADVVLHERCSNEIEGDGVINWEFDPYGFAPIAKIQGEDQYICVNDPTGTPREMMSDNGRIAWASYVFTYGQIDTMVLESNCPIRFQGQWYDEETGLHYNRLRYYDPEIGRYISCDPISLTGGLNVFTYTCNPVKMIDPFGLTQVCPDQTLVRRGKDKESAKRLAGQAAAAESVGNAQNGVPYGHGVSVTTPESNLKLSRDPSDASTALKSQFEAAGFEVRHTPTRNDPNHHTVQLPKPVTPDVAATFNRILGRT